MGFSSLGLHVSLAEIVTDLGYSLPTSVQAESIPSILAGKDVMVGAQTGTGKTAAFALPILHQLIDIEPASLANGVSAPRVLVLAPTRELAQQVHKSFQQYSSNLQLISEIVYGGVSLNTQIKFLSDENKPIDILIATPGRLLDLVFKKAVSLKSVQFLVFDEADRMLDMGFSVDINRILKQLPSKQKRQTLLFSATFDDAIFRLSKDLQNNPELIEVDARNMAASTVEQMIYIVDEDRKRELTSYLIGSKNWQQVLIFTRTKQVADELAAEMIKDGIKTLAIHGDKTQGARERALAEFKEGQIRALVATDVAARGLDIQKLQYVINYELPYVPEDYIHRIGRTGRAGDVGIAISLCSLSEEYLLEEIEALLDSKLPQQWLPGYEPDPTKPIKQPKKNSRTAQKQRSKKRAYGKRTANTRSANSSRHRK